MLSHHVSRDVAGKMFMPKQGDDNRQGRKGGMHENKELCRSPGLIEREGNRDGEHQFRVLRMPTRDVQSRLTASVTAIGVSHESSLSAHTAPLHSPYSDILAYTLTALHGYITVYCNQ